jgi:hypothetical protein
MAVTSVSVAVGFASNQLWGFLTGRKGIPRPSSFRLLVPEMRRRLADLELPDLLRECTMVRFMIEAGHLSREDVGQFLEAEGYQGWMRKTECIQGVDLSILSLEGQALVRELYAYQLVREGKAEIIRPADAPGPVEGVELATELVRDRGR